jgi:hypothetical protein
MGVEGFCGCCNPTHMAILPDGSFVTSEKGLPRVKIHAQSGELKAVVAAPDSFAEHTVGLDLAVDSAGRILVLDPVARAVRIFSEKAGHPRESSPERESQVGAVRHQFGGGANEFDRSEKT